MKTRRLILAATLAAILPLAACKSGNKDDGKSAAVVNTKCPFTGRPVNPEIKAASYDGKQVGFCCNACSSSWASQSDAEKKRLLASAMSVAK